MRCLKQRIKHRTTTDPTSAVLRSRDRRSSRRFPPLKYGCASRGSARRVSFTNTYYCVVLFGQRVSLGKRQHVRRIYTISNFVSLQRVFALLPRRPHLSRSDNLSTCLFWQTATALKKRHTSRPVVYSFTYPILIYSFMHFLGKCLPLLVYYLPYEQPCPTLLIIGPHSISLPFLLQGHSQGDVCCWCSYSVQQFAGLRRHHDKVR